MSAMERSATGSIVRPLTSTASTLLPDQQGCQKTRVLLDELAEVYILGEPFGLFPGDLVDVGTFTEPPIGQRRGSHPPGLAENKVS